MKTSETLIAVVVMVVTIAPPAMSGIISILTRGGGTQEEAPYNFTSEANGYEEREYPASMWACTEEEGGDSLSEKASVFSRLFNYIDGDNNRKIAIKMAVPVSIQYTQNEEGQQIYLACFYVPSAYQNNPPTPTSSEVFLMQRPRMNVLTRKFDGYATTRDRWMEEAESLKSLVSSKGEVTRSDIMFWNAYDPPYKFWSRRNEVWLVKSDDV